MAASTIAPLKWGTLDPQVRGPVLPYPAHQDVRNAIGTYRGPYSAYTGLAAALGSVDPSHRPDFTNTQPSVEIRPHPNWSKIVTFDPFGHLVPSVFANQLAAGIDVRPTIAVTKARLTIPEIQQRTHGGGLKADHHILLHNGDIVVSKAAIDYTWHLPGLAGRLGIPQENLRRGLYEGMGGAFPDLIDRPELQLLMPPTGGLTLYFFGDVARLYNPQTKITLRPHDKCDSSDIFGSDICTCRPYLILGIERCIRRAQKGGLGIIAYFQKEGRCLGEVLKYLVYNARSREPVDSPSQYFQRTQNLAGVPDMRFQGLMPDFLHWLGLECVHELVSMSKHKHDAIVNAGIKVKYRMSIAADRIPGNARTEIEAKVSDGYYPLTPQGPVGDN